MKSRLLSILLLLVVIHEVKSTALSVKKSRYLDIEKASRKLNTTNLQKF